MRLILILTALLAFQSAAAIDKSYLKKEKPDELALFVFVDSECPFSQEEVEGLVSGVLIRARLKPDTLNWPYAPLYLDFSLSCLALKNNNPVFVIKTAFGRRNPKPAIMYEYNYGTYGVGPKENIEAAIKDSTEKAITAYIQANFIKN